MTPSSPQPHEPVTLAYFDPGDGRRVAYRYRKPTIDRPAPVLLFLPGYASDMDGAKAEAIDRFAELAGLGCLRLDYSGTGSSGGDFADGTLDRWLHEVLAAIDLLVDGKVLVIGSSMGGWLALHAALRRKERVAGVIGIAAAPDFTDWGYTADEKAKLRADGKLEPVAPDGGPAQVTHLGFLESGGGMRLLYSPIMIDCPVRLIHGDKDADVPIGVAFKLLDDVHSGDVQLNIIKWGKHRLSEPHEIGVIVQTVAMLAENCLIGPVIALALAAACPTGAGPDPVVCSALEAQSAGKFADAAARFETAAGLAKPGEPAVDRMLAAAGNMWIAAGQAGKAALALDRALAGSGLLADQRGLALLDRARAAEAQGDLKTARAKTDEAARTIGEDPFLWYFSAALAIREERPDAAKIAINRALSLAPNDPTILFEAGHVYLAAGDEAKARGYWEQVIAADPEGPNAKAARDALAMLASPSPVGPRQQISGVARGACDPTSCGMQFLHTMLRVHDPDATVAFFTMLGLEERRRKDSLQGRFTLIFMAVPGEDAEVELTHNWPAEDGSAETYSGGRNFGHLAYRVDDIYALCGKLQDAGVTINRPPRDGHMAFVKSPDGISIELLQKGAPLEPAEPWLSMPNEGAW